MLDQYEVKTLIAAYSERLHHIGGLTCARDQSEAQQIIARLGELIKSLSEGML